jgi:proteasome inhibitor subunit 1 (PI31)
MIVQKLIPGLRKEGYSEQVAETAATRPGPSQPQPARPQPTSPPQAPELTSPLQVPPRNPLEIGRSDLSPFPRNPFAPPSLFPGSEGDGMFVGPNHPIFGQAMHPPSGRGPWGGDGFLPPLGAPPGARFDPVGPGLGPFPGGPLPGRGLGGGGIGRGMPGGGNMRDPDFDDFPPPGGVSLLSCYDLIVD